MTQCIGEPGQGLCPPAVKRGLRPSCLGDGDGDRVGGRRNHCQWDKRGVKRGGPSPGDRGAQAPNLDVKALGDPGRAPYVNIIFTCNSVSNT